MSKGGLGCLEAFDPDQIDIEQWLKLFKIQPALEKKDEGEKVKWCHMVLGFQADEVHAFLQTLPQELSREMAHRKYQILAEVRGESE